MICAASVTHKWPLKPDSCKAPVSGFCSNELQYFCFSIFWTNCIIINFSPSQSPFIFFTENIKLGESSDMNVDLELRHCRENFSESDPKKIGILLGSCTETLLLLGLFGTKWRFLIGGEVGMELEVVEVQSSLWSGSCSCCIAPSHQPMQPTHLNLLQKCKWKPEYTNTGRKIVR